MSTRVRPYLPEWLKIRHRGDSAASEVDGLIRGLSLHSVCQSAHCPNRSECWAKRTASFMVMGDICTRACRFCAVKTSPRPPPLDRSEPENLAKAVGSLGLKYVVVTSVTRDDLPDQGSGHIASCVRRLAAIPGLVIETLVPDFRADERAIRALVDAEPDVISHNIETVERLTPQVRDRRAGYQQSLMMLSAARGLAKERGKGTVTKSGIMVGFGETKDEVAQAMHDLRDAGVDILTIGQYLAPTKTSRHLPVREFIEPSRFEEYERLAYDAGFMHVASGPFVRSSYRASEPFEKGVLTARTRR